MKTLHKKFRSGLSLLALVGLALLPVFSVEADTPGVNDKEIRIGAFGPFGGPVYLLSLIHI